jgi:uncharacterized protein YjbI with pentapeptide repeats
MGANFVGAVLIRADLTGADTRGAVFWGANVVDIKGLSVK